MKPLAILFDLDNTLVDRDRAHRSYWEEFLRRYPGAAGETNCAELLAALMRQDDSGYQPRKDYFAWVATVLTGLGWDAKAFWQDYRNSLPNFIQPDLAVNRVIESVNARYRIAVVSNGSRDLQRRKLEKAGLRTLFSTVFISEECGFAKPTPEIFLVAASALGCSPREALFVGDDPRRDINGAAAVGCQTCWVSHGRSFPAGLEQPGSTIRHLADLPGLLEAMDLRPEPEGSGC